MYQGLGLRGFKNLVIKCAFIFFIHQTIFIPTLIVGGITLDKLERVSLSSPGINILALLFTTHCTLQLFLFSIDASIAITYYMCLFDQKNELN